MYGFSGSPHLTRHLPLPPGSSIPVPRSACPRPSTKPPLGHKVNRENLTPTAATAGSLTLERRTGAPAIRPDDRDLSGRETWWPVPSSSVRARSSPRPKRLRLTAEGSGRTRDHAPGVTTPFGYLDRHGHRHPDLPRRRPRRLHRGCPER